MQLKSTSSTNFLWQLWSKAASWRLQYFLRFFHAHQSPQVLKIYWLNLVMLTEKRYWCSDLYGFVYSIVTGTSTEAREPSVCVDVRSEIYRRINLFWKFSFPFATFWVDLDPSEEAQTPRVDFVSVLLPPPLVCLPSVPSRDIGKQWSFH